MYIHDFAYVYMYMLHKKIYIYILKDISCYRACASALLVPRSLDPRCNGKRRFFGGDIPTEGVPFSERTAKILVIVEYIESFLFCVFFMRIFLEI